MDKKHNHSFFDLYSCFFFLFIFFGGGEAGAPVPFFFFLFFVLGEGRKSARVKKDGALLGGGPEGWGRRREQSQNKVLLPKGWGPEGWDWGLLVEFWWLFFAFFEAHAHEPLGPPRAYSVSALRFHRRNADMEDPSKYTAQRFTGLQFRWFNGLVV